MNIKILIKLVWVTIVIDSLLLIAHGYIILFAKISDRLKIFSVFTVGLSFGLLITLFVILYGLKWTRKIYPDS